LKVSRKLKDRKHGVIIPKRNHRHTCPFEVGGMRDIDGWEAIFRLFENPIG